MEAASTTSFSRFSAWKTIEELYANVPTFLSRKFADIFACCNVPRYYAIADTRRVCVEFKVLESEKCFPREKNLKEKKQDA